MPCLSMFGLFHSAMYSKFICIVINAKISSFLRLYKILVLCMYHIFFIHPSVIGHLDCFNIVGVVSSASVNMRYLLQILFSILLDIQPEQDCWTTYQHQFLFIYLFLESQYCFPQCCNRYQILLEFQIPTGSVQGIQFLLKLINTYCLF